MGLVMIPNVSEGERRDTIVRLTEAMGSSAKVLDVHSDAAHGRTVLTATGTASALVSAAVALGRACIETIDLRQARGVHPRMGVLDVCPFVPHEGTLAEAVAVARAAGKALAEDLGIPVYLYGEAAVSDERRSLPAIRRGGLARLIGRIGEGSLPDLGPATIDPSVGVTCVGARNVLIAFNVWMRCEASTATAIATRVRAAGGGSPGVRALGLQIDGSLCQVSMNLVDPDLTGIDAAFDAVRRAAEPAEAEIIRTEIVGLVPERYMPDPNAEAARLMDPPGRSLESMMRR